jgi:adenylate kinase
MQLILLGAPGTGKGTQANILADRFDWLHVSTGDLLREAVATGSELGKQAQPFMTQGALVPDEIVIEMLAERLQRPDAQKGFVLDGFPRTLAQAVALDEALTRESKAIDVVLNIVVPDEELLKRLTGRWICPKCGAIYHEQSHPPRAAGVCDECGSTLIQRDDDKPETVKARLARQQMPAELLRHYRDQRKLVDIDGNKRVEQVTADLLSAVEAVQVSEVGGAS